MARSFAGRILLEALGRLKASLTAYISLRDGDLKNFDDEKKALSCR